MSAKKVAWLGMLVALAFVFSYIEFLIPINLGIPGVKLGLANLVIMIAIYTIKPVDAWLLSLVRVLLVGITFGNMASFVYSLGGALLSFTIMIFAKRSKKLSIYGVSILGGVFHNVGQILVAIYTMQTYSLVYYLPVIMISGIVSGACIGLLGGAITKRIKKIMEND